MNLADLKNIDIKKIDMVKIRSDLLKRQDLLINGAAVFLTIFIMFKIFSGQQEQGRDLKIQASQMERKITAIAKHDQALKELNAFVEILPVGIPESALIDKVSDFAEKSNIHIVTSSPTEKEENEFYKRSRVSLQISADHYTDFVHFVHDIENSSLNLRVDRWLESMESQPSRRDRRSTQDKVKKVLLDVSALYFPKKI